MKIAVRKSDGCVMQVADCSVQPTPSEDFTVHDVPGWDWSLANLTGVDTTQFNWVQTQLMWDGTTLVKRV